MSVLVYIETTNNKINKGGFEVATYGRKTAEALGTKCDALVIGACDNLGDLSKYGLASIMHSTDANLGSFDSQTYTKAIQQAAQKSGANTVILRHSSQGKALVGRLAIRLDAGSVSGVNALPDNSNGFKVKKGVYSGKAFVEYQFTTDNKVLTLMGNSIQPEETGSATAIDNVSFDIEASKVNVIERKTVSGTVPLPEAELVVSAGRGMKGPENWGIIEDLAEVLGATTACSRPVADTGWRPHHEHVGQTGVAIRPNLYIAAGISGAIQHLAGVNNSKTIVVINKDPDAPFFKAADYGVVGDLFDVVPKLTEAIKRFKNS